MENLALVTWTHDSYDDIFPVYFGNIEKFFPSLSKSYVLINEINDSISDNHLQLINDENVSYVSRWLGCLDHIEEEYILYMQEDFVLYDHVEEDKINNCLEFLKSSECSCVRLIRSGLNSLDDKVENNIYKISHFKNPDLSFTHQPTIWKKDHFIKIMEILSPQSIRDVESNGTFMGSAVMKQLGYYSSYYFDETSLPRGGHYDSKIFPYIATALIKGKWNTSQYGSELNEIAKEYNLDFKVRGEI